MIPSCNKLPICILNHFWSAVDQTFVVFFFSIVHPGIFNTFSSIVHSRQLFKRGIILTGIVVQIFLNGEFIKWCFLLLFLNLKIFFKNKLLHLVKLPMIRCPPLGLHKESAVSHHFRKLLVYRDQRRRRVAVKAKCDDQFSWYCSEFAAL